MTIKGHLDLFSGIGGFSLALKKVGIEPNWIGFSDIDKYANALFQRRFKNAEQLGDVSRIKLEELPKDIELLTGGFPCQPFSIAGSRLAFEDTRGTLFYEIVRILKFYIQEGRPIQYIVLENVKGLYSAGNRSVFPAIYKILTDIGYSVECELLNSKFFGVPQNRERIYFVGRYTRGGSRPKVFPITKDDRTIRQNGKGQKKFQITNSSPREFGWRDESPTLCARDYKDPKWVKVGDFRNDEGLRVRKEFISPCLPARRTSETDLSTMPPLLVKYGIKQLDETLEKNKLKKDDIKILDLYNRAARDECVPLTNANHMPRLYKQGHIRRLTPIECERLQGFPDQWTDGQSDTQRYKQCGNAITVNVAEVIFKKLFRL